jgi:molybdopterin/thiamine biosynthesis adenylyltransferase
MSLNLDRQNIFLKSKFKNFDKNIFENKILIVGCGGVGSNLLKNLVQSGFTNLVVIDNDIIDTTNLSRQFFFQSQIGKFKVEEIKNNLNLITENNNIKIFKEILNKENYKKICENVNLIIDTTDNISSRFLIEEISQNLKIDWIYSGAIKDESIICQFYYKDNSKYFKKIFPNKNDFENEKCSEIGVLNSSVNITSSLILNQIFNYFLNKKENKLLKYNGLNNTFFEVNLK